MSNYFDLHTQGIGYLNRVREVRPKNGLSFWACDIAALHGSEDNVNYTRFDCRVSGAKARLCHLSLVVSRKCLICHPETLNRLL